MSINSVVISGRLGKDPETRVTPTGKSVAAFSLAVDDGWGKDKSVTWVQVETWDKTAEAVGRLLSKGKRAIVAGRLKEYTWESNGEKKSRFKVLADRVEVIDYPDEKVAAGKADDIDDSDIPF